MQALPLEYVVHRASAPPPLNAAPDHPVWSRAAVAHVDTFYARSSSHHPRTDARLLYDDRHLYLQFDVDDGYLRAVETEYQNFVCRDSCVEFFIQPVAGKGYINFEFNCIGTMFIFYIVDPTSVGGRWRRYSAMWPEHAQQIRVHTTLPRIPFEAMPDPVRWRIAAAIPLSILEPYVGPLDPLSGQACRGNFYKCADRSSHPHWASWSPIAGPLNFHQPQYFGTLAFEA